MRSFAYKFLFITSLLTIALVGHAQTDIKNILENLKLNQALYPPEDILQTKSVVLFSVPMDDDATEWQNTLDEMQQFFAEVGVDAVAYLPLNNYDVGMHTPQAFPEFIKTRGIENLIIFSAPHLKGPYFIAILPFNKQNTLYNPGTSAFARLASDPKTVWQELGSYFKTDQFRRTNLLVNENPEMFYPTVAPGLIARSIPSQVAEFKIALKPYDAQRGQKEPVYRLHHSHIFAADSLQQVLMRQNQALEALAADTTNTMALVDRAATSAELRRAGFIYELQMVQGTEEEVSKWIPFPNRTKTGKQRVYKFYLNDLRTNTIYVGKEWDASGDWFLALARFVEQIRLAATQKGN